jgi:hypothetical protein
MQIPRSSRAVAVSSLAFAVPLLLAVGAGQASAAGVAQSGFPVIGDVFVQLYASSDCTSDEVAAVDFLPALPGLAYDLPVSQSPTCAYVYNDTDVTIQVTSGSTTQPVSPQAVIPRGGIKTNTSHAVSAQSTSAISHKGVRVNFWQGISLTDENGDDFEVLPAGPGEIEILPSQG